MFEPKKLGLNERKLEKLFSQNPILRRTLDEVRTWIIENMDSFYVPSFKERLPKAA